MICGSRYIFFQFTVEKTKIVRLIRILETYRNTSFHFEKNKTMARIKPDFEEVIPLKMIPLSLKLNPTVLDNMEAVRAIIKQNRNTYINLAIDAFNHYHRYKMIKKRMDQDAYNVTTYYLEIIKEFEEINQSGILKEL